ncbi:hypothetical protein AgCh_014259 [Apium graveolens]
MESREKRSKQEIDISNFLPEAVFSNIISWLPVKEAVRTSVLVKSWKYAWKYVMRLDLDPASISEQNVELAKRESQNGKELTPIRRSREYLMRCTELYTSVIQSIKDEVTHSQIVHFSTNINSGELEKWVEELLMRKKVRALSLKCFENAIIGIDYNVEHLGLCAGIFSSLECLELTSYRLLDTSPFQSCERLRTLKLSGLVLGVAELQAYCSAEGASQELRESYLTQEKLLERCTGFLSCYERSHPLYSCRMGYVSAFHNLQVLSTSLDLNDIRQAILLSYIFRVCFQLKRLDITVEVRDLCKVGKLCHPEHLFWEKKGISDCIACCLRAVTVQNFRGQVLEIEFVKYLTTRAPRMRRVTVKCADNCTNKEITAIRNLLSFPRSPMNVSVVIEPPSPTAARFTKMVHDGLNS